MKVRFVALALVLLLARGDQAFAAETTRLRWPDAVELVRGKRVEVVTTAGGTRKGRVTSAGTDTLVLDRDSSQTLSRNGIAEIRLIEYAGNGRRSGKIIGGGLGLLGGLVGAIRIGGDETSLHKGRDKAIAATLAVAGLPAGLLAGYWIGRRADREVTVIRIIPE